MGACVCVCVWGSVVKYGDSQRRGRRLMEEKPRRAVLLNAAKIIRLSGDGRVFFSSSPLLHSSVLNKSVTLRWGKQTRIKKDTLTKNKRQQCVGNCPWPPLDSQPRLCRPAGEATSPTAFHQGQSHLPPGGGVTPPRLASLRRNWVASPLFHQP